jgi:hypothetical protein
MPRMALKTKLKKIGPYYDMSIKAVGYNTKDKAVEKLFIQQALLGQIKQSIVIQNIPKMTAVY